MRSFERAQASVGGSTGPNSKAGIGINLGLRVWVGERVGMGSVSRCKCGPDGLGSPRKSSGDLAASSTVPTSQYLNRDKPEHF